MSAGSDTAPVQVRARGLGKDYVMGDNVVQALKSVDADIRRGEFVAIMGPSGSGKSTLLNIMGLLDAPTRGTIQLNGHAVEEYADPRLARIRNREIGFIFQTFHLISDLTALDNVEIPLIYRRMPGSKL